VPERHRYSMDSSAPDASQVTHGNAVNILNWDISRCKVRWPGGEVHLVGGVPAAVRAAA
jgi:hypothetical protein